MCNPRRVMIHLARSIREAWRHTVEQTVTAGGTVDELARIHADINLGQEMGDRALEMLSRVFSGEFEGFEAWRRDDSGRFIRDMNDVILIFDPKTGRMTVEARLTEMISAQGRGLAQVCGFTVGEVAAEAIGHYYSDGWGGRTRKHAQAEAVSAAEKKLDKEIEALHRQQHVEKLANAEAKAKANAENAAEEELGKIRENTRRLLRDRFEIILEQAQERVFHIMNQAVGEAYRQTLYQLVKENGGRIIRDQKTGSVVNMEIELY